MKKVGIASCIYQDNYGSMLQAYATQSIISKLGFKGEFIDYRDLNGVKIRKRFFFFRQIINYEYVKNKIPMLIYRVCLKFSLTEAAKQIKSRFVSFDRFRKKYFEVSPRFFSLKSLSDYVTENYSVVMVGSDQLWLPANVAAGFYTLGFVPNGIKKASFATSIGQSYIPESQKKQYREFLKDYNFVSVREKKGAELLFDLTDKQIEVISDPVFALTRKEWFKLADTDGDFEDKYVLCYFLGKHAKDIRNIKRFCETNGLRMVLISNIERVCKEERVADNVLYSTSPEEFLNLIRHADYVCTDSFHCSAFSIIFGTKFIPFMKYRKSDRYSTNGRLFELLEDFGIKSSVMDDNTEDINLRVCNAQENVEQILDRKKLDAEAYLRRILQDDKSS